MTENERFFVLTDDEYDTRPCIRDRTFKIKDIYGDYKYDNLEEICNEFNRLNDENKQLKQTMREVAEILSDEVDVFSDKATEHDINAYIELKELDNKDAYYMATATKKSIKLLKELLE